MDTLTQIRRVWKPLVFFACLLPFGLVVGDTFNITGGLGANPVEEILDRFGNWALRFVMLTLAVTPLRRLSGWNWLTRFRRMLGLFTFFYALLHFLTWLILDQGLRSRSRRPAACAVGSAGAGRLCTTAFTQSPFSASGTTGGRYGMTLPSRWSMR